MYLFRLRGAALEVLDGLRVGRAAFLGNGGVAFVLLQAEAVSLQQLGLLFLDVRIPLERPVLLVVLAPGQAGQREDETQEQSKPHKEKRYGFWPTIRRSEQTGGSVNLTSLCEFPQP